MLVTLHLTSDPDPVSDLLCTPGVGHSRLHSSGSLAGWLLVGLVEGRQEQNRWQDE